MNVLKKFHNYIYGVRFHVEKDGNTSVHQLYLTHKALLGVQVIHKVASILLFPFSLNYFPVRICGDTDGVSQ